MQFSISYSQRIVFCTVSPHTYSDIPCILSHFINSCVSGNKQLAKYVSVTQKSLPHLKAIVVWDEETLDKDIVAKCGIKVYLW